MSVIRLRAGQGCQRCGTAGKAHASEAECLAAIDREMLALLKRTRLLATTRTQLLKVELSAQRQARDVRQGRRPARKGKGTGTPRSKS